MVTREKLRFVVGTRPGGGFIATCSLAPIRVEADTFAQLRAAVRAVVAERFGPDRAVALLVGGAGASAARTLPTAGAAEPAAGVDAMVAVASVG